MLSTICRVANALPQLTQWNGSASFNTRSAFQSGASNSRGVRLMAFSGQVFSHSPHCTQLRSMNLRRGNSVESMSADSGQALTQDMQRVQVSLLTLTAPHGLPCGRAISWGRSRPCLTRCSMANSSVVRFSLLKAKVAGGTEAAGLMRQISCSSTSGRSAMSRLICTPVIPKPCKMVCAMPICARSAAR